jgi:drug/metabolite transporter (DMT)-like permease
MKSRQELTSDHFFSIRLLHTMLILDACLCAVGVALLALAIVKRDRPAVPGRLLCLIGVSLFTFAITLMQSQDDAAPAVMLMGFAAIVGSAFLSPQLPSPKDAGVPVAGADHPAV